MYVCFTYWRVNRPSWCGSNLKTPGMSSRPDSGRERDLPETSCYVVCDSSSYTSKPRSSRRYAYVGANSSAS